LDTDSGTPKEVADSLVDLRWFNRWFGGIATTRSLIQTVAHETGKSEFSVLEVAAGDGSLMQAICASLQNSGIRLNVTLLDRALTHLPAVVNHNGRYGAGDAGVDQDICVGRTFLPDAVGFGAGSASQDQKQDQSQRRRTGMSDPHQHLDPRGYLDPHQPSAFSSAVVADALSLPFPDSAFDLVSCSLFVHHLSPDQVTTFARESLRVCRHAALVHDLVRHPLHLAFAYAGTPLYRSRLTRNDAPASVRQAYTIDEMKQFFRTAGAASVDARMHYFYRMGVIAWKGSRLPA
jgi:ubiquinone/menaquinone biosynthesis C-methylase UbiE